MNNSPKILRWSHVAALLGIAFLSFAVPADLIAEEEALLEFSEDRELLQPIEVAQVRRRRPGASAPKRRERKAPEEERIPAATTPEKAAEQAKTYEEDLSPVSPFDQAFPTVRDRWTMLYDGKWYDPYNQNILKGDLRLFGEDGKPWFLELGAISDTLAEFRRVPTPVGIQSTRNSGSTDVFGDFDQTFINQNFIAKFALIRGNTVFRPQDFELRVVPVFNLNYLNVEEVGAVRADPSRGTHRDDAHLSFLELFIDYHLFDVSDRYDFISSRFGIQDFNADFRGFVYRDDQPGVRLFGNWDNNKWQWNAAWFHRLEKDANSLLNKIFDDRKEDVFIVNLYRQDLFALGHTSQLVYIYRDDTFGDEGSNFDENQFLTSPPPFGDERPKNLHNSYVGFNTDGHFGRMNVTSSLYYAFGSESHNPIAGRGQDISAFMAAVELSVDCDWMRPRVSFFWASGDDDPYDGDAKGFDAIFDNPSFVGGDNSYWQRQGIPLIAGGGVVLTDRSSLLPDLRAGKAQGQSNFVNPGIFIYNVGLDLDLTPKLLWFNNLSYLQFDDTSSLEAVRQDGSIDDEIGVDISTAFEYRPFLNNNIQIRAGAAVLLPGDGIENLYGDKTLYQAFTNLILLY